MTGRLHPDDVQAIAEATARHLHRLMAGDTPRAGLVDAAVVADALGVTRDTVYRHAELLGGRRGGAGTRGRWRFDLQAAVDAWTARTTRSGSPDTPRASDPVPLLRSAPGGLRDRPSRAGSAARFPPVRSLRPRPVPENVGAASR